MLVYAIHNLTKVYNNQSQLANNQINLDIHAGEIFGLLGANGAGKSTLVRQMVNLLRPTSGYITLYNQPVEQLKEKIALAVGYMPQDTHALNTLTIGEALYFTSRLRGLNRNDAYQERDRLLDLWRLGDLQHKRSDLLSGGQRRLLHLAVAMAGNPPVLILDEPTNDLDPSRRKLVWDVLQQLNENVGTTIIFITHDAIEAEKVIQRVGIMRRGELVAVGRPRDLKKQVDHQLRLDLFFSGKQLPALPAHITPQPFTNGHWRVLLEKEDVAAVMGSLDLNALDDFRLYSATLEDLYLHYADKK